MKALYKTQTVYTYQEYFRFNRALMMTMNTLLKMALFEFVVAAVAAIMKNPFILIFCLLFPAGVMLLQNSQIRKAWRDNRVVHDITIRFAFYDDCFTQTSPSGESQLAYSALYGYLETSRNVYLLISPSQGYILCKSAFPEGLCEHLRRVVKKRR